jgi:hypothetical protein
MFYDARSREYKIIDLVAHCVTYPITTSLSRPLNHKQTFHSLSHSSVT